MIGDLLIRWFGGRLARSLEKGSAKGAILGLAVGLLGGAAAGSLLVHTFYGVAAVIIGALCGGMLGAVLGSQLPLGHPAAPAPDASWVRITNYNASLGYLVVFLGIAAVEIIALVHLVQGKLGLESEGWSLKGAAAIAVWLGLQFGALWRYARSPLWLLLTTEMVVVRWGLHARAYFPNDVMDARYVQDDGKILLRLMLSDLNVVLVGVRPDQAPAIEGVLGRWPHRAEPQGQSPSVVS